MLQPQLLAGRMPAAADEVAVGYEDPGRSGGIVPPIGDTIVLEMFSQKAADRGQLFSDEAEWCRSRACHGMGHRIPGGHR